MDYEFSHRPSYTHLTVSLQQGESIIAEPGAMVGHSTTVDVETETSRDGLLSSVARCTVAKLVQTYYNSATSGRSSHFN